MVNLITCLGKTILYCEVQLFSVELRLIYKNVSLRPFDCSKSYGISQYLLTMLLRLILAGSNQSID
jgi:hypothetical protein